MTVNNSRSQRQSLLDGATDGKYRKARPDTEIVAGAGADKVVEARQHLHPTWNYGYINSQVGLDVRDVPGSY